MFGSNIWLLVPVLLLVLLLFWPRKDKRSKDRVPPDPENNKKSPFFIKPILQLGNRPKLSAREEVELHWHSETSENDWSVRYRQSAQAEWKPVPVSRSNKIKIEGHAENYRFSATLSGLLPGTDFEYEVLKSGKLEFSSSGLTRKSRGQAQRIVIVGDMAEGGPGSRKIAYQIARANPDILLMAGDLVYRTGRMQEYLKYFLPVYNSDTASKELGAPIIRSRIALTEVGNHDVGMPQESDIPDLDKAPDLMAHYILWSLPLNGPVAAGSKKHVAPLAGKQERLNAFLEAAGERYPRIGNYSADAGDCHWLVLDSNIYVDWTDAQLLSWVEADLQSAQDARWKLVSFHHASFTAHWKHSDEQRMRILSPIFERHGVKVVFSGHNHTYERSFPLRFEPVPQSNGKLIAENGHVDGKFTLDKEFDGTSKTRPDGVIYIVTGGGGARQKLMSEHPEGKTIALPPFTVTMVDNVHSFTCLDMTAERLSIKQISEDGSVLDSFEITQ